MVTCSVDINFVTTPTGFLKICETAMALLALSVSQGITDLDFESASLNFFVGGVLLSSIVISSLILSTYLLGSKEMQKTLFEIQVNIVLAIEMVVAGSLVVTTYSIQPGRTRPIADSGKAVGCMCIINSFFYVIDAIFAYLNFRNI